MTREPKTRRTLPDLTLRRIPGERDLLAVRELLENTEVFTEEEIGVGVSLVRDRLERGSASEYHLLLAELRETLVGFGCYGVIGCAPGRFDIYWIAVEPDYQGLGIGREVLLACERSIRARGGVRAYVETSSREAYAPARGLYERGGYVVDATQRDFYADGDHKITLVKTF